MNGGVIALKRQLVQLADQAARQRGIENRLTSLIQILPVVEALIQSMTPAKVKVRVWLDDEEVTTAEQVRTPETPDLRGGEHLIVNDEGRYEEPPEEAPNHQVPRDVLAALHAFQSLVEQRGLFMLAAVCGYSVERAKWTGTIAARKTPESLPYLLAGIKDSILKDQEATP